METYTVTFDHSMVPPTRITAPDLPQLAHDVATYLANRKVIRHGNYHATVGDDGGRITQPLLPRPIHFMIRKDA